jgi:phospholipid/cholesterol/gamma-HCH transport system substrate-binding protein
LATQGNSGPSDHELEQALPEQKGSRDASVGLFVLLGAIALIVLLYLLTDPAMFRGRYLITTAAEEVAGLRNKDPVRMRGVDIGRVNSFEMDRNADSVTVVLGIEGEWTIPSDSRTRLVSGGVISGGRIVEVVPGAAPTSVGGGDHIPGEVVLGVLEDTSTLGDRGRELLDKLNELLSDSTVSDVKESLSEFRSLLSELADVAETQGDELGELVTSLKEAASGVSDLTGDESLKEDLRSTVARADSMMTNIQGAAERLDRVSGSLETILTRMERGEGTLGQLSVNDTLYVTLTSAVESLRVLLDDLRENPGRYINLSIF